MHKMLPAFLKPEPLQKYIPTMDSIAKKLLKEHWDDKKEVLAFTLAKAYTISIACKVFMSIEDPFQLPKFVDPILSLFWQNLVSLCIPIDLHRTAMNKAGKASNIISKDILEIIRRRKLDLAENKGVA
ncbi:hypothetical protein IFM89_035013 [Coptis chinensis]|uniref:Uncharacterized protein n=1 Tax=Coptis chinensis TaxID=261450 RepID=A0A835HU96_9MAGN|nr:hypothetical protein IFM89_035013 [Coptis chinensis]